MIARCGGYVSAIFRRIMPDPIVLAVLLAGFVALLAMVFGRFPAVPDAGVFGRATALADGLIGSEGMWKLLTFAMQMCLVLVTGHALASSRPVARLIRSLAALPRTGASAAALVGFTACVAGLLNWGLGLIVGALLAREVGRVAAASGKPIHYPLIVAAGYMGLLVWHGGLSGTAPLSCTSVEQLRNMLPAAFVETSGDNIVTPLRRSLFSMQNLLITGGLVVLAPVLLALLAPRDGVCAAPPAPPLSDAEETRRAEPETLASRLDRSRLLAVLLAGAAIALVVHFLVQRGVMRLGLNEVNLAMFGLGMLAHGSLRRYMQSATEGVRGCAGILVQFPIYAAVMSMMVTSGLIGQVADHIASVSTPETLPMLTCWSAALLNLAVPSGGGQWAVQGPIALQTALQMGVEPGRIIMAVAYGDQLTNMLQPFWALPLLAITGVKARDIVGYCAVVMLAAFAWVSLMLLVWKS
ncbi:MAG: short-chain fatty acid transporter [Phycisphaeraceae bacterium]|nr:short-chain fatty acid transporter [Phycisphaeraceae bacterium]MCW5754318.1 short-chain fatty acid transporter [Phycisphaeraceae bacterium]